MNTTEFAKKQIELNSRELIEAGEVTDFFISDNIREAADMQGLEFTEQEWNEIEAECYRLFAELRGNIARAYEIVFGDPCEVDEHSRHYGVYYACVRGRDTGRVFFLSYATNENGNADVACQQNDWELLGYFDACAIVEM